MFARIATFEGVDVASAKKSTDKAKKILLPVFQNMPGWLGSMDLADAKSGKVVSIAIFNSAENAAGSEETFDQDLPRLLGDLMKDWTGKRVSVDQCEIILQLPSGPG